jgi:hypothetical protein
MAVKESVVQKALMVELQNLYPTIYLRKIHQSQYSHAGIPDLLGCLNGKFFAIEVKTDTGKTTKLQDRELGQIKFAKGISLVCYGTKDIERVIDELRLQIRF